MKDKTLYFRENHIHSRNGFTFVEIMIATALLGFISMGISSLVKNMTKSNLKAQTDSDILLATNEITGILSDPVNCLATIPSTGITPTKVSYKGINKFIVNKPFGNTFSVISSYSITYPASSATEATFNINYKKKTMLGTGDFTRRVNLYIEVAPGGVVLHCRSIVSTTELWTRGSGVNYADIFFSGNVGVGTSTPAKKLDVFGSINIGSSGDLALSRTDMREASIVRDNYSDGVADRIAIQRASGGIIDQFRVSAKNSLLSGDVGIGTLGLNNILNVIGEAHISKNFIVGDQTQAKNLMSTYNTKDGTIISAFDSGYSIAIGQNNVNSIGLGIAKGTDVVGLFAAGAGTTDPLTIGAGAGRNITFITSSGPGNGVERVLIKSDTGNVGVGTSNPAEKLHVGGNLKIDGTIIASGTITSASDIKLKKDILPLEGSLQKILGLKGISFKWINKKLGKIRQIGFIAQEVENIFPELVMTDSKGIKSVAYQNLTAPLVEAIREQQSQIESLRKHQKQLEKSLCEVDPRQPFCIKTE